MSVNLERKADEIRKAIDSLKNEIQGVKNEIQRHRQDEKSGVGMLRDRRAKIEERTREIIGRKRSETADDAAFWGRRFVTSITLGNAAGLFGVASYIANAASLSEVAPTAFYPFVTFLLGTFLGAMQPAAEAWKAEKTVAYYDAHIEWIDDENLKSKEAAAETAAKLAQAANRLLFALSIIALIAGTAQVLWALWPR